MNNARFLMIFVDGWGLASSGPANPFSPGGLPRCEEILGGAVVLESVGQLAGGLLCALDATLGVAGLPQSATGQATLFCGSNAAVLLGRHIAAFPGPQVRCLIDSESVFLRVRAAGGRATFANAFSKDYFAAIDARRRRYSASVCAVLAAGGRLRTVEDWRCGEAATWDIEGDIVAQHMSLALPRRAATSVGRQLVSLASRHHFTLFETFLPDLVAHGRLQLANHEVLRRLDGVVSGALGSAVGESATGVTVIVVSDHGNFEDLGTRSHTRNPVPLLAVGPHAGAFAAARSLVDVLGCLMRAWRFDTAVNVEFPGA